MIEYTCGFAFTLDRGQVLLIEKNRPDWQKGLWNGIGGKVKNIDKTIDEAMSREFREETGIEKEEIKWQEVCVLRHIKSLYTVYFYRGFSNNIYHAKTNEDEIVKLHGVYSLPEKRIQNLNWLIPLCLDKTIMFPIEIIETETMSDDIMKNVEVNKYKLSK